MKMIDFEPTGTRIFVETESKTNHTSSGLSLPEKEHEATPTIGTVSVAGKDSKYKPGDIVLFRRYSVDEIKFDSPEGEVIMHLLEDDDVVAKKR